MNLPPPKAVLLDWDNTLVDSWAIIHDAMNVTLTRFGLAPWSMSDIRGRVRKSMRDSFPELFGDRWRQARDVFYERFREIHVERLTLLPGAEALIEGLSERGIYTAIVSNKNGAHLRREVEHLSWDKHLGGVVGANDAERDKPAVDPVLMALARIEIAPAPFVWFGGDADIDMDCAHNAGASAVLIRAEPPAPGEFAINPPMAHVADCHGFLALIDRTIG